MTVQFLSKLSKLASTFFSTFERNYTDTLACPNFDGLMLFDHSVCTCIHETVSSCWANFQVFEFISIHNNTQFSIDSL